MTEIPEAATTSAHRGAQSTRLLVIVNDIDSHPGTFLRWMIAEKVEFDLRIGGVSSLPTPDQLSDYDGMMMFGGPFMPDDLVGAPWLAREAELVRTALDEDIAQLGICLGGQLLAHVIGGDVRAETGAPEKGYTWIDFAEAAATDPVFASVPRRASFIESHVDRIVALPPEATLLASSEACRFQAFRIGKAWGTQFHPEATVENIHAWEPAKLQKLGLNKETLIREAEERAEESGLASRALFEGFLAVVRT